MAPMKVYGWLVSPWMAKVLLCLEEAGVDYQVVPLSLSDGDHRRPEHLARNPFGQIPVLEDGDLTLYQSHAIARYILGKHKPELLGLGEGGGVEESAMVDMWLEVETHQYEAAMKPIVWHCIVHQHVGLDRDQAVVDECVRKLKRVLEVYEARLSSAAGSGSPGPSRYIAGGGRVSLADLSHLPLMHYFAATEYAGVLDAYPRVRAWWEALRARPSVKKVMAAMPTDFGFGSGSSP
ncbi:glutathione S-transferase 4-like [Oryza brachyantha]|uniref:glutathione S-transferase 4-like n=1 Tax=Oryza brachyantha TaxID=4533 RepID=UPI001ADB65C8|nr:glutathione S-transferase 4-like [Oryza brachyantha]